MKSFSFFFLVTFVASSKLSNFSFGKNLQDLKDTLNAGGDIKPILGSFMRETRHVFMNGSFEIDQEIVREYVAIKEEMICLLHKNDSIDFSLEEISIFNLFLFEELTKFEVFFSQANLHIVLLFLLKASSKTIFHKAKEIASGLAYKLTPVQMKEFIKFRLLDATRSSTDIEEKIRKLSTTSDPEEIYSIISDASNQNTKIQISYYEMLAENLHLLDFEVHPDWLFPILDALKILFSKNIKSQKFIKYIGDLILSDKIINIMKSSPQFSESYAFLLYFAFAEPESFSTKFDSIWKSFEESSSPYADTMKIICKLFQNIQFVVILDNYSNENDFKTAISAFGRLIKLKKENDYARQVLAADYKYFSSLIMKFTDISTIEKHPLFTLSLMVVGMIGYLGHDLIDDDKNTISCYCNIVSGFGYYILKNGVESEHVINFIEDFRPLVGKALDALINRIRRNNNFIGKKNLQSMIRFSQLVPDVIERHGFIDRIYSHYISDIQPQYNKYYTIKDREIGDNHGVHINSFLTFLDNYAFHPTESQLPYLKEYYMFLKDSKLLNKTELLILENNFNGFKYRRVLKK